MLPAKGSSNIGLVHEVNKMYLFTGKEDTHDTPSELAIRQHLYILINEKIKEGDKVIFSNKVITLTKDDISPAMQERQRGVIIATTDHSFTLIPDLPKDIVHAYIKAYNEGNPITEVEVNWTSHLWNHRRKATSMPDKMFENIKSIPCWGINKDGTLAVTLIEDIKGTPMPPELLNLNVAMILDEEVKEFERCKESLWYFMTKYMVIEGRPFTTPLSEEEFNNKWIKENL